ncbi:L-type lectin-domain containing receptor kinase SIT2-like isoform X2 [Phragmites australis]|nr:L-type lectin-domain containing receptor kinase SIT2-like isoform X2 [Phragmites australis]
MAFVVAPTKSFATALPAGYLALLNVQNNGNASNHLFAIELDTTQNTDFQDINANHVGIDVNNLHSVQSYPTGYYDGNVFKNLTLFSREAMQVWVEYDGETGRIDVTLAPIKVAKPARPLVSATYDLSTVLKNQSYIGFSSATGGINSRHYVLGWSFAMNGPAPAIDITKLPKLPRFGPKPRSKVLEIVLPIATAAIIITVGTVVTLLVLRKLRYAELLEDWELEFGPHRFLFKDLYHATDGFKSKHLLGVGGFGKVYKGVLLKSKLEVAVKRVSHESRQGMKEFIAEVVSIGRLRHRNLVQLLGYCRRKGELLLVYEYMPNGSLDKYLYCEENKPMLDWTKRFHIIKGVASGLLYIHEKWEKVVIHRDIKASNVLLDSEMNGRLGDFGLARLYDHGTDPQTTHVVGTMGYLAPELIRTGKASKLTDVFAFGAFLLEITCGQRPVNNDAQDNQEMLVDWVLEHLHKGSLTETVDLRLRGEYNVGEVCLVLKLGLLCSHPYTNIRPNMRQVMQYLDGDTPLPDLASTNMSFSTMALMQNEGFDSYAMSFPSSAGSIGTVSFASRVQDDMH